MPRQRIHHTRETYDFPADFPERLVRFQEESGLTWAELNQRLGTHPFTMRRSKEAVEKRAYKGAQVCAALQGRGPIGGRIPAQPYGRSYPAFDLFTLFCECRDPVSRSKPQKR